MFLLPLRIGVEIPRKKFLLKLADLQYSRNDTDFKRGTYRVRGDIIDIIPAYESKIGVRIEFFGDTFNAQRRPVYAVSWLCQ